MVQEKYNRYRLIDYFDVLGNAKDGYDVNDLCVEFDDLYISKDMTEKEILNYLKDIGFLNTSDRRKLYIIDYSGSGSMLEIYGKKGNYPIGRLERVD